MLLNNLSKIWINSQALDMMERQLIIELIIWLLSYYLGLIGLEI